MTPYNRKHSEKKKNEFKNLLKEEKSKVISEKRLKERLWQQKYREKLRQQCTQNINKQRYSSVQALSRATNKVRKYLPYSPSKQRAVVMNISKLSIYDRKYHHSANHVRFPLNGNRTIGH